MQRFLFWKCLIGWTDFVSSYFSLILFKFSYESFDFWMESIQEVEGEHISHILKWLSCFSSQFLLLLFVKLFPHLFLLLFFI